VGLIEAKHSKNSILPSIGDIKELFIANFEFKSETEIIERTLFDELNNRREER